MTKLKKPTSKQSPKIVDAAVSPGDCSAWLPALLAAGFAIKIAYLLSSQKSPFYQPAILDPAYYHKWALQILKGSWAGQGVFYGLPLYPFFLAGCYKLFGISITAVKIVQALLGIGTLFFIYKLGEKIFSRGIGLLAVVFAIIYGPLFFHETLLIPEALALPLYALSLYLALSFWDAPTHRKGALLGFFGALAVLTKAGILSFLLLFWLITLIRQIRTKGRVAPVLLSAFLFFLTLCPVTLHNFVLGKDAVFLTSHSGFNFYIGNNEKAQGVFAAPEGTGSNVESQMQDSRTVAENTLGRTLKASEVSKYWSGLAWEFIRTNPSDFLKLSAKKMILFFDSRELSDVEDYEFAKKFSGFLAFPWVKFAFLGPLFFVGSFVFFRKSNYRPIVFLWMLSYVAGVVLFFVNARYRLPLLSIFFVLAAAGVSEFYRCLQKRLWVNFFLCVLIFLAGVAVTQAKLTTSDFSKNYLNAGDIYLERKDYEETLNFYTQALKVNPESERANEAMGVVLTKIGRYEEALDYYLRAVQADPNSFSAYNQLGLWYDRAGELEKAKTYFLKALEFKPVSSQVRNNLGMVYGKMGDNIRALEEFERSLLLNPSSPRASTNKGLILHRLGRREEAKSLWRRALELDPGFEEARKALSLA